MKGQINRGTEFGDAIYEYALNEKFKTYVEIGTWNGQGSTKCFVDGLLQRKDDAKLHSLETDLDFYNQAKEYWHSQSIIYKNLFSKLKLIHGRVVEGKEIFEEEKVRNYKKFDERYLQWRNHDLNAYETCKNVLSEFPKNIDVLLLDGGEFSTYKEFLILKDRTKIIMLDDTQELKCEQVVTDLESSDEWVCIHSSKDRQGWAMYKKK